MADENETSTVIEGTDATVAAVAKAAEPKKQRAPRQKKASAEVVAPEPAAAVKSARVPRKKSAEKPVKAAAAVPAVTETKPGRGRKAAVKAVKPAVVASDEFSDLLALEEENKSLRKALAEKLKAENADLRKKLGQA